MLNIDMVALGIEDPQILIMDEDLTLITVEMSEMTVEEIVEYTNGYKWNEENGEKKNYGSRD